MRPRQQPDRLPEPQPPRASIVDLPSAHPLGGESSRRTRTSLLVVLVVGFVAVAWLKPWEPRENRSPGASASPLPSARPSPTARPGAKVDWSMAGPVLAERDAWGLRALVVEGAASPASGPGATPRQHRSLLDRLAEVWVDAQPAALVGPEPQPSVPGQVVTDAVLVPTGGSAVAAIGVTSPNREPIIDIRLWFIVRGTATRVDVQDLPGIAPGVERLLVPPASLSRTGDWPAGTYRFDLLVGQRVVGLTMVLPFRPHNQQVVDRVAELVSGLPEGLFVVRPESNNPEAQLSALMVPDSPVGRSSKAEAWLQLSGGSAATAEAAAVALAADPAVVAIGIHGPIGEQLITQVIVNLAPLADGRATFGGVVVHAATGDVAIFELSNGGLQAGLFRLDTGWSLQNGWRGRSWFLDVTGEAGSDTTSPLLAAARDWAGWAGRNVILAAGQVPVEQLPNQVLADSDELGTGCFGGVMVAEATKVIGVGYAGARPDPVLIHRLFTGGRTVPVRAAVAADTVPGLLLMADASSGAWAPGYYEVALERATSPARYVFCVGEQQAGGSISVPADAASVEAYREAVGP